MHLRLDIPSEPSAFSSPQGLASFFVAVRPEICLLPADLTPADMLAAHLLRLGQRPEDLDNALARDLVEAAESLPSKGLITPTAAIPAGAAAVARLSPKGVYPACPTRLHVDVQTRHYTFTGPGFGLEEAPLTLDPRETTVLMDMPRDGLPEDLLSTATCDRTDQAPQRALVAGLTLGLLSGTDTAPGRPDLFFERSMISARFGLALAVLGTMPRLLSHVGAPAQGKSLPGLTTLAWPLAMHMFHTGALVANRPWAPTRTTPGSGHTQMRAAVLATPQGRAGLHLGTRMRARLESLPPGAAEDALRTVFAARNIPPALWFSQSHMRPAPSSAHTRIASADILAALEEATADAVESALSSDTP